MLDMIKLFLSTRELNLHYAKASINSYYDQCTVHTQNVQRDIEIAEAFKLNLKAVIESIKIHIAACVMKSMWVVIQNDKNTKIMV